MTDADFVERMRTPQAKPFYGYSTWLRYDAAPAYYHFSGHLGQFIIVVPEHDLVVVRLGRTMAGSDGDSQRILDGWVAAALQIVEQAASTGATET